MTYMYVTCRFSFVYLDSIVTAASRTAWASWLCGNMFLQDWVTRTNAT